MMNDRIKELAEQAGLATQHNGIVLTKNVNAAEAFEKFAELIIKECFDVVINDGRFHDAKGIIRAGKGVAMEHFGVEE